VVALPDDGTAPRTEDPPGAVLLLQPSEPLAAHTTYTVTLGPVVRRAGSTDQVTTARTWRFTTGQPTTSAHNHVAYLSAGGGMRDLWLMNPDGSAPRQVTAGLAPVSAFDVTLDGTRVAVAAGGEIRTMAIDGSGESVLTTDGRFEYAPRFSPDGGSLLFARREADGTDAGWWLTRLAPDGAGERQLLANGAPPLGSTELEGDGIEAGDGFPVWAGRAGWDPPGRRVLLTTATGQVVLVDLQAEDAAEAVRPTGLTAAGAGAWSSSIGRFIIVGRTGGDQAGGLYSVDAAGIARRISDGAGSVAAADGRMVALLVRSGETTHVAIGDVARADAPAPLTSDAELSDRWPAFSPDGATVLFGRVRGDGTVSAGIWTIDVAGGGAVALSTEGAYPRWLP
jgi:hypothetical protein